MSDIVDVRFAEAESDICVSVAPEFNDEILVEFATECSGGISVKFDDVGRDGKDGVSPIVKNGTWWTWDDAKGEFVDTGVGASGGGTAGKPGKDGTTFTPTVDSAGNLSWTNDGGLDNPETVNITGPKGLQGKTPVKGTDYWTDADKAEIVNDVLVALPSGSAEAISIETIWEICGYTPPEPSGLPDGYTLLEYIESSGTQYIDTQFTPDSNSRMVLDFAATDLSVNNNVAGSRNSTTTKAFTFGTNGSYWRIGYNTSSPATSVVADTNRHTADLNKNVLSLDGTAIYTATAATFTGYASIYICAIHAAGTGYMGYAKIYSCQIYDNDVLVRDFVPCIDPDGEVGLYDKANKWFYGNIGTGSFVAGYKLPGGYTQLNYIQSSGTQYVDTGFMPNQDTRVVLDIEVTELNGFAPLFGGRIASKNAEYATWATAATHLQDGYGNSMESGLSCDPLSRNVIDKNKNLLYVNGNQIKAHSEQTFAPNYALFLFNINTAGSTTGSYKTYAKLYSCQIYDNGILVRDFVPCVNASGEYGLYDKVNSKFYGNAGSGAFTGA